MASRKTYFGIGWPKDAPDPDSGATNRSDPEDRSAPTVVDDEKVAEGLRQLRSWYQGDTAEANPAHGAPPAPGTPLPPGARPTAVGHATAPPAAVVQQRPIAPDPMRATMYGHDVHKFDLDTTPPSGGAAPPPVASSTALVVADPARQQQVYGQQLEAVPRPIGRSASDPFPMARQGEAERLQRPARASGSYQQVARVSRAQIASRIMFGIGLSALIAAGIFWYQAGGQPDAPPAPSQSVSSVQQPPSIPIAPPAALPPEGAAAPSQVRPGIPANPAPIPAAPISLPKTVPLRLPGQPALARTVHKRSEPKHVAEPTEVDEAATTVAPPVADKEAAEPKETKARPTDPEAQEVKAAKEAKETKAAQEAKPPKETAALKEPKEARAAGEPKERQAPKETKAAQEAKPPKETAVPKETAAPKQPKAPKSRLTDTDATLPPSPSVE